MTDFGFTNGYIIYNGLDQGEVFSSLLWKIFYDSLFYKIKHCGNLFGYRLNSKFFTKSGKLNSRDGLTSFLAAGAFVDDTIWIENSMTATQNILDITSEFFGINDIFINTDKMVAISINMRVKNLRLFISGAAILIAKRKEPHRYLGIFLSTDGLSIPSFAKTHSDVRFFTNLILKKVISDKQFLYLVSVVLQPIISYRTQFSYVSACVCEKWDGLLRKELKIKTSLPKDFPNKALYHPEMYGLKSFSQLQAENLLASMVGFANSGGCQLDAPAIP
ncbi:hypothetical protein G9A89_019896 [Geosiphon pyriformis]|nr:hypothetical protein G9A89_019896 [Geosiphon pyriformis]